LPPFLISSQQPVGPGDIGAGLAITGRFLETFVFALVDRPLPPARARLIAALEAAGRL
jgi:DNA repair protein RecO (recombination protein O)